MGKMIDLTGQRFGRLVVVKRAGGDKRNRATWVCKCDCGNEAVFFGDKNSDYSTMCYTYEGFRDFLSYVNVIEMNHLVDTPPAVAKDSNVIDFQVVIAHKSGAGN